MRHAQLSAGKSSEPINCAKDNPHGSAAIRTQPNQHRLHTSSTPTSIVVIPTSVWQTRICMEGRIAVRGRRCCRTQENGVRLDKNIKE